MMNNVKDFYKNKKILITGHTGFKGSWLTLVLNYFGAKVYGYSLNNTQKKALFNVCKVKSRIEQKIDNVKNYNSLKKFISKTKPQIIFHLAAQSLVKKSYKDPRETFETNFLGTLNILDICKEIKEIKSIIIITSDKCYLNQESKDGYSENSYIGGADPYSGSKAAAENVSYSYLQSYYNGKKNVGFTTVRAGNVIGGGDYSEDRIIPDFIKSLENNKNFTIRSPNATRPWQHILDLLYGYLLLAYKNFGKNKFNGSWNFGPSKKDSIRVLDLLQYLKNKFNLKKKIKIKKNYKIKETNMLFLKTNKARNLLRWKPKYNIYTSLKKTFEWYDVLRNDNKNILKFTNNQIKDYYSSD